MDLKGDMSSRNMTQAQNSNLLEFILGAVNAVGDMISKTEACEAIEREWRQSMIVPSVINERIDAWIREHFQRGHHVRISLNDGYYDVWCHTCRHGIQQTSFEFARPEPLPADIQVLHDDARWDRVRARWGAKHRQVTNIDRRRPGLDCFCPSCRAYRPTYVAGNDGSVCCCMCSRRITAAGVRY
jgi:hypothetical protein